MPLHSSLGNKGETPSQKRKEERERKEKGRKEGRKEGKRRREGRQASRKAGRQGGRKAGRQEGRKGRKERKTYAHTKICTQMFIGVLLTIVKRWEQPICLPMMNG